MRLASFLGSKKRCLTVNSTEHERSAVAFFIPGHVEGKFLRMTINLKLTAGNVEVAVCKNNNDV